jgi:hypothetical protein
MLLACDYWGFESEPPHPTREQTDSYVYEIVLEAYTVLFYLEALGKLRAYGSLFYFRDEWCRFELQLVGLSVVDQSQALYLISERLVPLPPMLLRMPRALYALRALRLMQHMRGVQSLVTTSVLSLPSLSNVCSILALLVFIFTVLGMQQFTYLRRGEHITDDRNYETFGNSLLVSLQCLTSDGWSSIMFEARSDPEHGSWRAVPFFLGFQVLVTVILNLVVAVILDNFTSLGGATNVDLANKQDVERFSDTWADFDPDATQTIPATLLPDLLKATPLPVGLRGAPRRWVVRVCLHLGLQANEHGELRFHEVLQQLIRFNYMMQMKEGLPPEDALPPGMMPPGTTPPGTTAQAERADTASSRAAHTASSRAAHTASLLWQGADGQPPSPGQLATARVFALELLRLSHGTLGFRRLAQLSRRERLQELRGIKERRRVKNALSAAARDAEMRELWTEALSPPAAAMTWGPTDDPNIWTSASGSRVYVNTLEQLTSFDSEPLLVPEAILKHLASLPPPPSPPPRPALAPSSPLSPLLTSSSGAVRSDGRGSRSPVIAELAEAHLLFKEKAIASASKAIANANAAFAAVQMVGRQALEAEAAAAEAVVRAEAAATVASRAALMTEAEELQRALDAAVARQDFAQATAFKQALEPLRQRLADPSNAVPLAPAALGGSPSRVEGSPSRAARSPVLAAAAPAAMERFGTLTLKLEGQLNKFSPLVEERAIGRLAAYGGVNASQLEVLSRRAGSVILEVAVMHTTYQRLTAPSFLRAVQAASTEELSEAIGVPVLAVHCEFRVTEPPPPPLPLSPPRSPLLPPATPSQYASPMSCLPARQAASPTPQAASLTSAAFDPLPPTGGFSHVASTPAAAPPIPFSRGGSRPGSRPWSPELEAAMAEAAAIEDEIRHGNWSPQTLAALEIYASDHEDEEEWPVKNALEAALGERRGFSPVTDSALKASPSPRPSPPLESSPQPRSSPPPPPPPPPVLLCEEAEMEAAAEELAIDEIRDDIRAEELADEEQGEAAAWVAPWPNGHWPDGSAPMAKGKLLVARPADAEAEAAAQAATKAVTEAQAAAKAAAEAEAHRAAASARASAAATRAAEAEARAAAAEARVAEVEAKAAKAPAAPSDEGGAYVRAVGALEKSYTSQLRTFEETHASQLRDLAETHERELRNLEGDLRQDLERTHASELRALQRQQRAELEAHQKKAAEAVALKERQTKSWQQKHAFTLDEAQRAREALTRGGTYLGADYLLTPPGGAGSQRARDDFLARLYDAEARDAARTRCGEHLHACSEPAAGLGAADVPGASGHSAHPSEPLKPARNCGTCGVSLGLCARHGMMCGLCAVPRVGKSQVALLPPPRSPPPRSPPPRSPPRKAPSPRSPRASQPIAAGDTKPSTDRKAPSPRSPRASLPPIQPPSPLKSPTKSPTKSATKGRKPPAVDWLGYPLEESASPKSPPKSVPNNKSPSKKMPKSPPLKLKASSGSPLRDFLGMDSPW